MKARDPRRVSATIDATAHRFVIGSAARSGVGESEVFLLETARRYGSPWIVSTLFRATKKLPTMYQNGVYIRTLSVARVFYFPPPEQGVCKVDGRRILSDTTAITDTLPTLDLLERLVGEVEQVFHGKEEVIRLAVAALLARGHILFEDVPGVGKTTLAHALATALGLGPLG